MGAVRPRSYYGRYSALGCMLMLMHTYMPNANAGTVVFWHGRLGREAGPNYGSKIRQAILYIYDFSRKDMNERDTAPPSDSMWRDWSEEVKHVRLA